MQRLARTSRHAAGRLRNMPILTYSVNAMGKEGIACFGHCTANIAEGTNGVLEPWRNLHPYEFVDTVCERIAVHRKKYEKLVSAGKLVTSFASAIFKKSYRAAQQRAYRMQQQADNTHLVWDPSSRYQVSGLCIPHKKSSCMWCRPHDCVVNGARLTVQVRHVVNIDRERPSCSPCAIWSQYRVPCQHMALVLGAVDAEIFHPRRRAQRVGDYFHPAYRVANGVAAFKDQVIKVPQVYLGPSTSGFADEHMIEIGSDGEEVDTEAPVHLRPMLPPTKYSLRSYKSNPRRGRPPIRRKRSRGALASSGGAAVRQPRRANANATMDDRARNALNTVDLSDF